MRPRTEGASDLRALRRTLVARGYQEAITYSFVDNELQQLLDQSVAPVALSNPISSDMDVMRISLLPGLLQAAMYNLNREQQRVRLFESGLVFRDEGGDATTQRSMLGAVAAGPSAPGVWEGRPRDVDLLDVKGDLEALFGGRAAGLTYRPCEHPALHPGQAACVSLGDEPVGVIGAVHPGVARALRLSAPVVVFEITLDSLRSARLPRFQVFSRFPSVRRDLSLVVDEAVSSAALCQCVGQAAGDVLKNLELFDLYRGEGIDSGRKSLSLALTLQDASRTLDDSDADAIVQAIVHSVATQLGGFLRG
jgi:phenylalanyl-tRNA synthetase beta chain